MHIVGLRVLVSGVFLFCLSRHLPGDPEVQGEQEKVNSSRSFRLAPEPGGPGNRFRPALENAGWSFFLFSFMDILLKVSCRPGIWYGSCRAA